MAGIIGQPTISRNQVNDLDARSGLMGELARLAARRASSWRAALAAASRYFIYCIMEFMRKHYPNVVKETFGKTIVDCRVVRRCERGRGIAPGGRRWRRGRDTHFLLCVMSVHERTPRS